VRLLPRTPINSPLEAASEGAVGEKPTLYSGGVDQHTCLRVGDVGVNPTPNAILGSLKGKTCYSSIGS